MPVKKHADLLHEDLELREFLSNRLQQAGLSKVVIGVPQNAHVLLFTPLALSSLGRKALTSKSCVVSLQRKLAVM